MAVVTAGAGDRKGRTGQHVCPRLDHCSPPLDTTAVAMSLRVQLTILTSHDLPFVRRRLGSPPLPPTVVVSKLVWQFARFVGEDRGPGHG